MSNKTETRNTIYMDINHIANLFLQYLFPYLYFIVQKHFFRHLKETKLTDISPFNFTEYYQARKLKKKLKQFQRLPMNYVYHDFSFYKLEVND